MWFKRRPCVEDGDLYLCLPLSGDSSNVPPHHVANVDLLQELWDLQNTQQAVTSCRIHVSSCCHVSATHLPHDRRRGEPGVFLQDGFGKVLLQPCEVALPHVGQVLTVVHAGRLISGHETFDEPAAQIADSLFYIELLYCDVTDSIFLLTVPFDDFDGPSSPLPLLPRHQTPPTVFNLCGYFDQSSMNCFELTIS